MLNAVIIILGIILLPITLVLLASPFLIVKRLSQDGELSDLIDMMKSLSKHIKLIGFVLTIIGFLMLGNGSGTIWDTGVTDGLEELSEKGLLLQIVLFIPYMLVPFLLYGFLITLNTLGLSFVLSAWLLKTFSSSFNELFLTDLLLRSIGSMPTGALIGIIGYLLMLYGVGLDSSERENV